MTAFAIPFSYMSESLLIRLISQSLGILGKLGKSSGFWSFQFEEEDALEACLKDLEAAYSAFNVSAVLLIP